MLILGPKVTPPGHVSTQVAQLNTHTQHSEESSVKLGDMRHCLSLVNEKSFPSALVDIFNLEVNKQDQIFWKASLVSIFVLISLQWEV